MRRHIYYTLQSLLHKQGSNAIKIVSLALGLLMSVFLFARIAFELSFDNFYHDSDNLYIVKTGWLKNGVLEGNESRFTIIPIPAAIAEEFPEEVESSTVSCSLFDNSFYVKLTRESSVTVEVKKDPVRNIERILTALRKMPGQKDVAEERLEGARQQLVQAREEVNKPFEKENELRSVQERLTKINAELDMKPKEEPKKMIKKEELKKCL